MTCTCYLTILAIVTVVLCTLSTRARYYGKGLTYGVLLLVAVLIPLPLMFFRIRDYRNALIPAFFVRNIGRLLGFFFELHGLENIRPNGGVVVINHQSAYDLIVLACLWPVIGRATVVAKKEVLYLQPFAFAAWMWGTLFIDRNNRNATVNSINNESKAINEKQAKILFFPEGTRNQCDHLKPFKKGPFCVAIESQCPIQPVVVSRYHFLDAQRKFHGRGRSIIHILPEIQTKGLGKDDISKLIEDCHKTMNDEYIRLNAITNTTKKQN